MVHEEEWKESSDPSKDIITRFLHLCGKYKKDAFWIIITDSFFRVVGTCTMGEEDEHHLHLYNVLVAKDWRGSGFGKKLIELAKTHAKEQKKNLYGFVKHGNDSLVQLYKKSGAVETDLFPRPGYTTLIMS
jgi:ribosomal protein S18 acetylase RimI-like enzyme